MSRQPEDHKAKAVDVAKADGPATNGTAPKEAARITAQTEANPDLAQLLTLEFEGEQYHLDPEAFNDVEVMEKIGDMQDGKPYLLTAVVRSMLGDSQWAKFKDAARDPVTHRVPAEKLGELFTRIDNLAGNLPASPGS